MGTGIKFRGVVPKKLDEGKMRLQLLNGLRLVRTQMLEGFHKTTKTWEHKVEFVGSKPSLKEDLPTISVTTDDDIYTLVNEGSPRHYIPLGHLDYPLFFHSEYGAKTAPGVIDSWEGGPGEKDTFADVVDHPGFPGRKFDEAIGVALQDFFFKTMEEAMQKAARASGYSLRGG